MSEVLEIQQLLDHVQSTLENLITRGLRAASSAERNTLTTLAAELMRVGAGHLAERIGSLNEAIEHDRAEGPVRLLQAQASLRLFERVLTLEVASGSLGAWQAMLAAEAENAAESE